MTSDARSQRQRLLEAGGEIFADVGFHQATVRRICRRARANVAAIKYHFGGKAQLYREALAQAHCPDGEASVGGHESPEQRLRGLIAARLLHIFDERRPAWHGRLLSREMVDPTPALDRIVGDQIRPRCEQLQALVRELLGPDAGEEQVRLAALSIISQCVFYHHARAVLERLFPAHRYGAGDIERLADHISRFSLAALQGMSPPHGRRPRSRPRRAVAA